MPIPKSVQRTDMLAALEPLFVLLGVDPNEAYAPIIINWDSVDFALNPTDRKIMAPDGRGDDDAAGVVVHKYSVEVV